MSHVRECQQCGEIYVPANGPCQCEAGENKGQLADPRRECDCCGEMKYETRFVYVPHAGDTVICEDCTR